MLGTSGYFVCRHAAGRFGSSSASPRAAADTGGQCSALCYAGERRVGRRGGGEKEGRGIGGRGEGGRSRGGEEEERGDGGTGRRKSLELLVVRQQELG